MLSRFAIEPFNYSSGATSKYSKSRIVIKCRFKKVSLSRTFYTPDALPVAQPKVSSQSTKVVVLGMIEYLTNLLDCCCITVLFVFFGQCYVVCRFLSVLVVHVHTLSSLNYKLHFCAINIFNFFQKTLSSCYNYF